jgi:glyoxylase-like metal-dependent hydrolase (beta-lactamase superfamily II)
MPDRSPVLVDPYLSRFYTGLFDPEAEFDTQTPLSVDAGAVEEHTAGTGGDGVVLVTHCHWDHFADVPRIATATGARVVGTLTAYHLAQAMGVPAGQVSPVRGGEVLDFDGCVVVRCWTSTGAWWRWSPPCTVATAPIRWPFPGCGWRCRGSR